MAKPFLDDEEDDGTPYDSVSDRVTNPSLDPLKDLPNSSRMPDLSSPEALRQMVSAKVAQQISKNTPQASTPVAPGPTSDDSDDEEDDNGDDSTPPLSKPALPKPDVAGQRLANDPLMKDYQSNLNDLKDLQRAKMQADHITNLGQAFAQAARGAQKPISNGGLYNAISDQNQGMLTANAQDLARRQNVMNAIENRNARLDADKQHSQDLALKQKQMNLDRQDKQDQKLIDRQNTFTNMLETRLNSSKQLPDVIMAYKDRYASSKLNKLLNSHGGDLDKLSTPQKNMVIAETAKIASGGAPDDHMMKMLAPESFRGKLAEMYQTWKNAPTEAHAGAFLKQYQDYAKDLTDNANQVINEQIGKNLEASRKSIGDENYNKLKSIYLPEISPPPPKESFPKGQGVPGSLVKVKGKLYKIGDDGDSLEEVM